MNVSGCVRLHGQSTSTYLAIANRDDQTVLAINDTHLLDQLTPQLLNGRAIYFVMRAWYWQIVT